MSKKIAEKKNFRLSKLYNKLQKIVYEIKNYKSKNIYKIYLYIKSNVENYKKKKLKRSKYISLIKKKGKQLVDKK